MEIKKSNPYGISTGTFLGRFSNTAAVAVWRNTSDGSWQIKPSRLARAGRQWRVSAKHSTYAAHRVAARLTVPSPTPISVAMAAHDRPADRRLTILTRSTLTRGRPKRLPLALAFRNPARTRSAIRLRSSSATAPRTVKTILPVGVLVSTFSDNETNSMPAVYADSGCTDATLTGNYSLNFTGWYPSVDKNGHLNLPKSALQNFVGTATFDGAGKFSTSFVSCTNGVCTKGGGKGPYSVNSDCSGKLKLGKGKNATPWTFAISNAGNQIYAMETDVANVSGTATKQ